MTAQEFKTQHPEAYAAAFAEGEKEGRKLGAVAEQKRLAEIDAVAEPGYDEIVSAARADLTATASDVAVKISVARKAYLAKLKTAHAANGAEMIRVSNNLIPAGHLDAGNESQNQAAQQIVRDQAAKNSGRK